MTTAIDQARLRQLPMLAIVAFVVRCARRAVQAARVGERGHEGKQLLAIDAALWSAETFAATGHFSGEDGQQASEASCEMRGGPKAAAASAAYAAMVADLVDRSRMKMASPALVIRVATKAAALSRTSCSARLQAALVEAEQADYAKLLTLALGSFPESGVPVDPSESGPLGPVWPSRSIIEECA